MGQNLHPQRTARRVAALLLTLLQLGATSLAAMDAVMHADDFGTSLHAEGHGHHDGAHEHLTCQAIQSLAATSGDGVPEWLRDEPPSRMDEMPLVGTDQPRSAQSPGSFGPRGPPTL